MRTCSGQASRALRDVLADVLNDGAIIVRGIADADVLEHAASVGKGDALVGFHRADVFRVESTAGEQRRAVILVGGVLPDEEQILMDEVDDDQTNDFAHVHSADHLLEAKQPK